MERDLGSRGTSVPHGITAGRAGGRFLLMRLDTGFDIVQLHEDFRRIMALHSARATPRADGTTHRSLSLTHRPGVADPLYDGSNSQYDPDTNQRLFEEGDFTEFNPEFRNTIFYDIYRAMPSQIGRMRLNLIPPLTVFTMHQDSAIRAHVAVKTNPDCLLISRDGQAHHVPVDGNAYIFDTKQPHTAFNASREERVHLTIALAFDD